MRSYPHSGRFDPRWLFPAMGTDGAELSEAPDDTALRDVDEAIEQIVLEGCTVCPLCRVYSR